MLGLKLNYVSKRGYSSGLGYTDKPINYPRYRRYAEHTDQHIYMISLHIYLTPAGADQTAADREYFQMLKFGYIARYLPIQIMVPVVVGAPRHYLNDNRSVRNGSELYDIEWSKNKRPHLKSLENIMAMIVRTRYLKIHRQDPYFSDSRKHIFSLLHCPNADHMICGT